MNPRNGYTHKDEWLTPPEIVQSLGSFDLDPCSPIARPWPFAALGWAGMAEPSIRPRIGFVA